MIREYRERYPKVKIVLKPGECWELRDLIRSGELDLAFLLQPETEDRELNVTTLIHEPILWLRHSSIRWLPIPR